MIVDYKYNNTNNVSNSTYTNEYIFNYFLDITLLFVLLIVVFGFKQVYKYYNCNNINNDNNLHERIISSTQYNNNESTLYNSESSNIKN